MEKSRHNASFFLLLIVSLFLLASPALAKLENMAFEGSVGCGLLANLRL